MGYTCDIFDEEVGHIMKVTSALANKMIKQLEEEKSYWISVERDSRTYTAAIGEEPVVPEYDYRMVSETIDSIDRKIVALRHAINRANCENSVETAEGMLTIDALLVRMAQLNQRKTTLDGMRKTLPKERLGSTASWGNISKAPEYCYANYDIELAKADYEKINEMILSMQLALDKYNQTFEFEIEL